MIDGGNAWILRNNIENNGHGIVIAGSIPKIEQN